LALPARRPLVGLLLLVALTLPDNAAAQSSWWNPA
jgi:hypothetical protein